MSKESREGAEPLRTGGKSRKAVSVCWRAVLLLTSAREWGTASPVLSHNSFALWLHGTKYSPFMKGNFSYYFSCMILTWIWGRWILLYLTMEILGSCTSKKLHCFSQTLPVYSSWRFSSTLVIQELLINLGGGESMVIFHYNIKCTRLNLMGNLIPSAGFTLCIWLEYVALAHIQQIILIFSFCPL